MTLVTQPAADGGNTGPGKEQKHDVTRRGPDGTEVVVVSAASGDEAATKAFMAGTVIVGVTPHDNVETVMERPRPLTLQGNPDGSSAERVEERAMAETALAPANAEDAKNQAKLDGVTTNAVGIEGAKGPAGKPAADLPKAHPAKIVPSKTAK